MFWKACILVLSTVPVVVLSRQMSYDTCDENSVPASVTASNLAPNTFHKLCPGVSSSSSDHGYFSHPQCGDGTPYAFFFTKPPKRKMNSEKILIEFMGGGACWDGTTCGMQEKYLTFPENLDDFVGLSCSEIEYGAENGGGGGGGNVNMLCSKTVGGVDFTSYNTFVVPYCTQDVHVGSNTKTYDDGSIVNHVGGANMMSVMNWIFKNFPNPSHIVLTGCSAGGTAVPIAYDLLNMHYNRWTRSPPGLRSVQISAIVDSAVYLTPSYFMENGIDNWNPSPIMKKINFPYHKYQHKEDYSTRVWKHVLHRGSNRDQWGFVTHNEDPVSEKYYQYMGGTYNDDDQYESQDVSEAWWTSLSSSLQQIQNKNKNVDTFVIDGNGHCTFGLFYALQEDGFDDWAQSILEEKKVYGRTNSSIPLFIAALAIGSLITLGIVRERKARSIEVDDGVLLHHEKLSDSDNRFKSILGAATSFLSRFEEYPVTVGLIFVFTFYFLTMLLFAGFTHVVDNPSLGPTAEILSLFGINNPTMIVYEFSFFRLLTSGFLCSGVVTYLIVLSTLIRQTRYIEQALANTNQFSIICGTILLGANLIYACFSQGASCASISLIVGLNTLSIIAYHRGIEASSPFPRPICPTITITIFVSVIFPFNSWLNILGGALIGGLFGYMLEKDELTEMKDAFEQPQYLMKPKPLKALILSYVIMVLVLIFQIRKPSQLYMSPFLTGCDLAYAEVSADVADSFYENRRSLRFLEEDADGEICAEFCIPHLVARPLVWGASKFSGYTVQRGQCESVGYSTHLADKTFTKATYSVDVEVYTYGGGAAADDDGA